jgi:methionyl-tRNA formyltransferase
LLSFLKLILFILQILSKKGGVKVVFMGTADLGVPALKALVEDREHRVVAVVTQPDRPVGRQQKLVAGPIKEEALKLHLNIFQPEKINTAAAISQLRYLQPDVIIVAAYGQILSKEILRLPPYGCFNLHASLLPKYRGAAPIQAAIRNRDRETGMTIMWMDEGLDTGDILTREKVTIRRRETAGTLHDRLSRLGAKMLPDVLHLVETGKAPKIPQDNTQATLVKKLRKEDGHIDWHRTQLEIDAHIRAMTPWPSAYSWLPEVSDHHMFKIYGTIISRRAKGKPGEVVRVDKHGILVAAGSGGLLLREVQLEGKKRMHAADFARGFNLPVGTVLE